MFIILVKVLTFASVLKAIDCFTKKKTEMKKLVFMFVAIAAMSFASCNNNKSNEAAPATDSDSVQVDSAAVDSTDSAATDTAAADTAAADAQ